MKCFNVHKQLNTPCTKAECRLWINNGRGLNCTLISAESGPMTLQEIGDIFGITRMRVCQLEKRIISKIKDLTSAEASKMN